MSALQRLRLEMATPAIFLNVLFFPAIVAGNAILFWAFYETRRAGVWPTENFFGLQRRKPWQLLFVVNELRQRIANATSPSEATKYRRILSAFYLGYGLGFFALLVLLAFVPWLLSQIP